MSPKVKVTEVLTYKLSKPIIRKCDSAYTHTTLWEKWSHTCCGARGHGKRYLYSLGLYLCLQSSTSSSTWLSFSSEEKELWTSQGPNSTGDSCDVLYMYDLDVILLLNATVMQQPNMSHNHPQSGLHRSFLTKRNKKCWETFSLSLDKQRTKLREVKSKGLPCV